MGIPQPTLYRYETGENKIPVNVFELLINMFNVNANWLFTGDGEMFLETPSNSGERQNDTTIPQKAERFGHRLAELQDKHEYLDKDMAKLLHISECEYMDIKLGDSEPDYKTLIRLKQLFKISIDWLLFGEN